MAALSDHPSAQSVMIKVPRHVKITIAQKHLYGCPGKSTWDDPLHLDPILSAALKYGAIVRAHDDPSQGPRAVLDFHMPFTVGMDVRTGRPANRAIVVVGLDRKELCGFYPESCRSGCHLRHDAPQFCPRLHLTEVDGERCIACGTPKVVASSLQQQLVIFRYQDDIDILTDYPVCWLMIANQTQRPFSGPPNQKSSYILQQKSIMFHS